MVESGQDMLSWLRRIFRKHEPLSGAPARPRVKTYSAASGYVYQYIYRGQRKREGEYVFDITSDLKRYFLASVFVPDGVLKRWQTTHGRELTATERYAIAKMALFQAFDEREKPDQMRLPIRVRETDLEAILERLGID
jgi:hypothetical protein